MSKQGEAWMCTNEALWLLGVGFVPEKGSKIEPKSNMDGSETAQKRTMNDWKNYSETLKTIATGVSGGHIQLWLVPCLAHMVVGNESRVRGGVDVQDAHRG